MSSYRDYCTCGQRLVFKKETASLVETRHYGCWDCYKFYHVGLFGSLKEARDGWEKVFDPDKTRKQHNAPRAKTASADQA